MAEGRGRTEWDRTASLMALLANCHRTRGKVFAPKDFHPYIRNKPVVLDKHGVRALMLAMGGQPVEGKQ